MRELALLIVSIGLVDSLNPTTVVPALYLASGTAPARKTFAFALGFAGVNLLGGVVLLFGPGRLAIHAAPHVGTHAVRLIEVGLGAGALVAAIVVWRRRARVRAWSARPGHRGRRTALISGGAIAAIELPTALPYFVVIGAVAESDVRAVPAIAFLALFNLAFIAPVLAIALLGRVAGERTAMGVERVRAVVLEHLASVLAGLLLLLGLALIGSGALGLVH